jgi:hypothetical protein
MRNKTFANGFTKFRVTKFCWPRYLLMTTVAPHTSVKMATAPPCLALRGFSERPELNYSQPLLWLVQFGILIMSLLTILTFTDFPVQPRYPVAILLHLCFNPISNTWLRDTLCACNGFLAIQWTGGVAI